MFLNNQHESLKKDTQNKTDFNHNDAHAHTHTYLKLNFYS